MRALGPLVFASILAAVPVSDAPQILPPRDAPVVAPDQSRSRPLLTSGIGGRIVDARTGEPLRRVVVRVQAVDGPFSDVVMTGVDGRYEVRELPPGRYALTAQRREYVPIQHGQTRFRQQGRPLELPAGTMLDIDLALPRGSVIRGHVVDEFGTPVVGARVTAESVQYAEGRPQLRGAGLGEPTDDLGRFRLFGLPPGEYYVSVEPPTRVIPGSPQAERMLAEERHVRTYYPGSLVATAATPVRVGFDDEAGDLVLPLLSTQVVVVSGSLSGVPAGTAVRVRLRPVADGTGGAGDLAVSDRLLTVHDAAFSFADVPPGWYTLIATAEGDRRGVGAAQVAVGTSNVSGIAIELTSGAKVSGRIVLDPEASSQDIAPDRIRVEALDPDSSGILPPPSQAPVRSDWTFTLEGLIGERVLRVVTPAGWRVQRMVRGDVDVLERPLNVFGDVGDVAVVLTNQIVEVSGRVTDAEGRAILDYVTVVFPSDPTRWGRHTRSVVTARPDQHGEYRVRNLPAGEYLAIAIAALETGRERDPSLLQQFVPFATRLTVGNGGRLEVNLELRQ